MKNKKPVVLVILDGWENGMWKPEMRLLKLIYLQSIF